MKAGKHLYTSALVLILSACGGGGGGGLDPAAEVVSEFSGSVGDGPIVGAALSFYDKDGRLLKTRTSDSTASYKARIRARRDAYPITVKASGGTDLVTGRAPDFDMTSVVLDSRARNININPFSTMIVESARLMPGGLNKDTVDTARNRIVTKMNYGLDTRMISDPIRFRVDDENVANIVKSSEALGEMIRRTRDHLSSSGADVDGNDIVAMLSEDISDGSLDGMVNGQAQSETGRKVSYISRLTAAQVLIESMSNDLKVDGVRATSRMDEAVVITRPEISESQLTESVRVNREMLDQLKDVLDDVEAVDSSNEISQIASAVDSIAADSSPSEVERTLPAGDSDSLVNSINIVASASDRELEQFEQTGGTSGGNEPIEPASPSLSITGKPATRVAENATYSFTPAVSGGDGNQVIFSIGNRPAWTSFNTQTGRLSGVPGNRHVGVHSNIVITANQNGTSRSLPPFSITVSNTNDAPTISGNGAATMNTGQAYNFQPAATDPDGDNLTFSIANKPSWASFNSQSGRLSGVPSSAGSYRNIVITVSDGAASAALSGFTVNVNAVLPSNRAPSISGNPAGSVAEGGSYVFQPSASDPDGDSLGYSIVNRPSWASFNSGTGRLSGQPGSSHAGNYNNIVISVSDGSLSASLAPFSINVSDVNNAPKISGSPVQALKEKVAYNFQPNASDADGDNLTFSISNRPSWASFSNSTGRLSGTPDYDDGGEYNNIVISVSDGKDSVSLPTFRIEVLDVNSAPVISGSPSGSVQEGSAYSFKPSASDPNGDPLSFSVNNKPSWASFNSSTGLLSGTPDINDVRTYSNIVVSVSDGSSSASLPAFNIVVSALPTQPGQQGSITVNWNAPVDRADGQALSVSEISTFTVYYGSSSGSYTSSVGVNDPVATSLTIDDLPVGDYYVVMTVTDSGGRESAYSAELVKQSR